MLGNTGWTKYNPVVLGRWQCLRNPPGRQVMAHPSLLHWKDLSPLSSTSIFNPLVPNDQGPAIVSWTMQSQVSEASSKFVHLLPDCTFGYYQQFPRNKNLNHRRDSCGEDARREEGFWATVPFMTHHASYHSECPLPHCSGVRPLIKNSVPIHPIGWRSPSTDAIPVLSREWLNKAEKGRMGPIQSLYHPKCLWSVPMA